MKIAYIKPNFTNEKRVGFLPKHLPLCSTEDERRFEQGYGENLGIADADYGTAGGYSRASLFAWADVITVLKFPSLKTTNILKTVRPSLVGFILLGHRANISLNTAPSRKIFSYLT